MLTPLNLIIIVLFFASMAWIGFYFAAKSKTTDSYFLGNKLPSWAIGLSMLGTSISSVTFLAFPAAAFILDWRQVAPNLSNPLFALLAIWLFVPFFRNSAKTTAFEYLQKRFGDSARLYASIMFLVGQSLRLGAILYLLSIPIDVMIKDIDVNTIIIIVGLAAAVYTLVGGMSASVWTDVVQSIILYIGGFAAIAVIIYDLPGGVGQLFSVATEHEKFSLGPMEWNLGERTFWTMILLGVGQWLTGYVADQNMVQRYLAAGSMREARKATLLYAVTCLPTWLFFFFIGTSLFVYYSVLPDPAIANLPADYVFPHFIMSRMPDGLSGLVIAGVLSAALGSLSSSLNAFATVSTVDILRPYVLRNRSDAFYSVLARVMTAVATVVMFGVCYIFMTAQKESVLDLTLKVGGILGGVTVCFFVLGFFAPRVNKKIIWQAFAVSFTLNVYLALVEWNVIPNFFGIEIHAYWVSSMVIIVMVVLALVLALIQRTPADLRKGMTLFNRGKAAADPRVETAPGDEPPATHNRQ